MQRYLHMPCHVCSQSSHFSDLKCLSASFRQSEASAHLGAILTGYDLLAMFVVRKLGLSLGELDDVTSETKSVEQVKAEVSAFGSQKTQ